MYELQRANIQPRQIADLSSLKIVTSTGMVLPDALFEWFYDQGFPPHVRLNNISGGTDLAGCFGIGNSLLPVHVGGCAGISLGIPVDVYDASIEGAGAKGRSVGVDVAGELVATAAFPNMPACFWGADGSIRYHDAYFARFDSKFIHILELNPLPIPTSSTFIFLLLTANITRCLDAWRLCFHPSSNPTTILPRPGRRRPEPIWSPLRVVGDLSGPRSGIPKRNHGLTLCRPAATSRYR